MAGCNDGDLCTQTDVCGGGVCQGSDPVSCDDGNECTDDLCRFDASKSTDADGRVTAWAWQFGDGARGSGEVIEHRYSSGGTFTVRLDVTDDAGATDDKHRLVKVDIPAAEPVAEFSVSCEGLNCTLDAGSSTASDGSIARYDWSFGDGTTANSNIPVAITALGTMVAQVAAGSSHSCG